MCCSGRRCGIRREEPEVSPTSGEPAEGRTEILRLCSCWRSQSIKQLLSRPLNEVGAYAEGVRRTGSALAARRSEQVSTTGGWSLPDTRERNGVRWLVRVNTIGSVDPGRVQRRPTDRPCLRGIVPVHHCLPGDVRACRLPGVARACNSRGGTSTTPLQGVTAKPYRGSPSLKPATGQDSPPLRLGDLVWRPCKA
jgi:hypothetical protein